MNVILDPPGLGLIVHPDIQDPCTHHTVALAMKGGVAHMDSFMGLVHKATEVSTVLDHLSIKEIDICLTTYRTGVEAVFRCVLTYIKITVCMTGTVPDLNVVKKIPTFNTYM